MLHSDNNDVEKFLSPISGVSQSSFAFDQNFADEDFSLNNMLAKIKPCNYYNDPSNITNESPNGMVIIHINIRSLNNNFKTFLSQFSVYPDIIGVTVILKFPNSGLT